MGLTLEFALGQADKITEALREDELDRLDAPAVVKARADISLHVTPHDLDTLSEEFASASGCTAVTLGPYLQVLLDESDRGVLLVDKFWISYVAAVPTDQARNVAQRWIARMSREYNDPQIVLTDDAVRAVENLVAICSRAKAEGERLVHLWFL